MVFGLIFNITPTLNWHDKTVLMLWGGGWVKQIVFVPSVTTQGTRDKKFLLCVFVFITNNTNKKKGGGGRGSGLRWKLLQILGKSKREWVMRHITRQRGRFFFCWFFCFFFVVNSPGKTKKMKMINCLLRRIESKIYIQNVLNCNEITAVF